MCVRNGKNTWHRVQCNGVRPPLGDETINVFCDPRLRGWFGFYDAFVLPCTPRQIVVVSKRIPRRVQVDKRKRLSKKNHVTRQNEFRNFEKIILVPSKAFPNTSVAKITQLRDAVVFPLLPRFSTAVESFIFLLFSPIYKCK